jgi:tRNA(fMet)-specific endonuclease VapC
VALRFLLDTNIVSEPLRPRPNASILEHLQRYRSDLAIAAPVWHELWRGCYRMPESNRRSQIEKYLRETVRIEMPILRYDEVAAEWHAAERVRLERIGKTPPFVDGQIIAVAKVNDLRLVTLNVRDFSAFEGVKVEDWR